jgi:hypothetical protein
MQQQVEIWSQDDETSKNAEFKQRGAVTVTWLNTQESELGSYTLGLFSTLFSP